ncbi:hypothetical protein GQX73_g7332 [Xylaria multiplex]|uniref:Ig-like domain-containing protein n=1 Tax=Xylaria multiplex TaxID=323545 RepID=A0A7C8N1T3_9PEZI|nr:hypothetical protein GQX73_g7332 [Xylaria multiplex]
MMYLRFLIILIAAAAAHVDALSVVSEVCITNTTLNYRPWSTDILKWHSSPPSIQQKTTFIKGDYMVAGTSCLHGDNNDLKKDHTIITIILANLVLEFIVIALVVWLGWNTCFCQWYRGRRLQRNPERQRAEQVLNSHPQPIDLELGVVHARSSPRWPLTDDMETRINTPNDDQMNRKRPSTGTSVYCDTRNNHTQTTLVEAGNLSVDTEGIDITDTVIPETYTIDSETTQAFEPITEASESDLDMPHHTEAVALEGPLSSTGRERETYSSCSNQSGMGSYMNQDGIIVKDWAYHNL